MINKKLVSQHFSKSAQDYDIYAHIQKKMARELVGFAQLDCLKNIESILDIGCGTGNLTRVLIGLFPLADITCMDIAGGMIDHCRDNFDNSKAEFVCADAEKYKLFREYDIIASNAAFQWFNDLRSTLKRLKESMRPGGVICFSTFGEKTFRELHMSHCKAMRNLGIDRRSRPGQNFYTLSELQNILNDLFDGEYSIRVRSVTHYYYFNSVRDFFRSVKKIGANNSNAGYRHKNPRLIKELIRVYEEEFSVNNRIRVTYECIYCVLKRL